ncbi:hypothetical protein FQP90_13310 [Paenarthrobacter nitroguajacolicus]|uniref:Bacterial sugar transferase domain-containing protein n=1 Tax=Paenarthrobacter nitroguajacolicus TaxID=211146 RepID=A0A558GYR9_PAENT|nr:sugar transferase [Paenarthrobacter nitroguajacolicus]TVU62031.1 hypothetical protein FQP90_13310 [Paenarthrobacter nitroguajacolicus]
MQNPEGAAYLEFLEAEFSHPRSSDGPGLVFASDEVMSKNAGISSRWSQAAVNLRPRSRVGFLFGATSRDIVDAATDMQLGRRLGTAQRAIKRMLDVFLAIFFIAVFFPIALILAFIVKSDSPGPVIYGHFRIGRHGQPFMMYKFRTSMRAESATVADGLNVSGALYKVSEDLETTRCGRWMKKYSLDEIPQLWNVLSGDMSMVGPRPRLFAEEITYPSERELRIRPGVTGLWQFKGRTNHPLQDPTDLDDFYISSWSIVGDIGIFVRTIQAADKALRNRVNGGVSHDDGKFDFR